MSRPSLFARAIDALAAAQSRRPFAVLAVALALTACAIASLSGLRVEGGFEHLLPDGKPSVAEYRRVVARTAGASTLFVVLEVPEDGPPAKDALRRAGDALVTELRAVGEPWVGSADDGVHDAVAWLRPRLGLYAELAELEGLASDLDARWAYEVEKASGLLLDEGDAPPPLDEADLRRRFRLDGPAGERFPDGYFQSADGRALAVVVRSKVPSSDAVRGGEALDRIRDAIHRVDIASFDARIRWALAGDLYAANVEVTALNDDLGDVGLLGAALVASVILLFYLRVRALVVLLLTIAVGIVWTAGLARPAVGTLSIGTSFVFTIVAGNGLNSGVIYLSRWLEARRAGAPSVEAIRIAHRETIVATASACAASSASFASLLVTAFRGFRDLGLVGAVGLVSCWVATVVCLPALLSISERWLPLDPRPNSAVARLRARFEAGFGRPFAYAAGAAPRAVTAVGVALAVVGFAALVRWVAADPMEYDLSRLRNEIRGRAEMVHAKDLADALTHDVGADGMAILVDRPEQVGPLRDALYRVRDAAAPDAKPFESVHALEDLVPDAQAQKLPVLKRIATTLGRMHRKGALTEEVWDRIAPFLPGEDLAPFGIDDLPGAAARPFTEADGTRGRIVYIAPIEGWIERSANLGAPEDARYLLRWAASYRRTELPDGSVVLGSGRAVIYADMLSGVIDAVPVATLASLAAVVLVTAIAFRGRRATLYVLGALAVGVGWMALLLVALDLKLNFLDFVALPITFGIGVEYAVNVVYRWERDGRRNILDVLRRTGGAVVLCSATTTLGYAALHGSINGAVRSLGLVAVLGEVCTLLAAMLVLPAALSWFEARGRARRASSSIGTELTSGLHASVGHEPAA